MYCTRNQNGTQHKTNPYQHRHGLNNSETSPLHPNGQLSISKISSGCAKQKPDAVTLRKPNSCSATPSPKKGGRRHPGASPFYKPSILWYPHLWKPPSPTAETHLSQATMSTSFAAPLVSSSSSHSFDQPRPVIMAVRTLHRSQNGGEVLT